MASRVNQIGARMTERFFLLLISVVMAFLFFQLFGVLKKDFTDVPQRLHNGTLMNLNDPEPGVQIKRLLEKGYYFSDKKDIDLIGSIVARGRSTGEEIDNIGELNKSKYNVSTEIAGRQGGEIFKKRVRVEKALIGFSGDDSLLFEQEQRRPIAVPVDNHLAMGSSTISGSIVKDEQLPVSGVLVRLQMILPQDSLYSNDVIDVDSRLVVKAKGVRRIYAMDTAGNRQLQSLTAFARTGTDGRFAFSGLPANRAFAVLPLQPGFEFGRSQGTPNLEQDQQFVFHQQPNTIRLFSTRDFNNLKKEKSLIVRTPAEATKWFIIIAVCFVASFWLLHILLSIRFPAADQLILPVIMLLTGFSFHHVAQFTRPASRPVFC